MNDIIPRYIVREPALQSGRVYGEVTTIDDNLLAVGVSARWRNKVNDKVELKHTPLTSCDLRDIRLIQLQRARPFVFQHIKFFEHYL